MNENTQQKKKRPLWQWVALFVIGCAGLLAVGVFVDRIQEHEAKEAIANAIHVNAEEMKHAYEENEVNADNIYKGKLVQVNGVVVSIGNDMADHAYVVLAGSADEATGVQATIKDKGIVASLRKGMELTVLGECTGKVMNVHMEDCVVR